LSYPKELLEHLYRAMVRIRLCEESFVAPILSGEVRCPCHLYSGEEAVAAGLCASLDDRDYVFGNHRSHGHFLAKGGSMQELVAEIYCRETGCSRGRGGSMHLIDPAVGMLGAAPIVAGTISLALGAALAASIRGERRVSVSFFGDGATGEGVLYESMNFASLRKLPIIFACENNCYATHMPIRDCRVGNRIHPIADPFCIEAAEVDGNDVLAVYEAGKKAVEKCRAGQGPVFLEFLTYRYRGHVGPDDNIQGSHTDIRPKEEIAAWLRKDPILNFERYIVESGLLDRVTLDRIRDQAQKEVDIAHAAAKQSSHPQAKELTKYVYK
jgi:acetoin:2,6-dichlorophenolindophenol oxidoreductase subunit alpha